MIACSSSQGTGGATPDLDGASDGIARGFGGSAGRFHPRTGGSSGGGNAGNSGNAGSGGTASGGRTGSGGAGAVGGTNSGGGSDGGGAPDSGAGADGGGSHDAGSVAPFRVYLAPPGNGGVDGNTGTDPGHPVPTLGRALAIIAGRAPAADVEVLMAAGVYYHQSVIWTYTDQSHTVTFKPRDPQMTVVFDGCVDGSTDYATSCPDAASDGDGHWLLLGSHPAGDTNLIFDHLEIRHYRNGIRFANGASARNRISNSNFNHIGNGWAPNLAYATLPGYGAVRSTQSSYNTFTGNRFSHIENLPGSCDACAGHMHSYYLSKSSDYNVIDGETHEYVSGGPVRFRDYSNHNIVRNSTFVAGGLSKGAVSDFYSPDGGECPCYDITMTGIKVYGDWDCARSTSVWVPYGEASTCTRPAITPRAGGSGNCTTKAAPYCATTTACQAAAVSP